jgi:membrane-associated phospholipid phosphatase
LRSLHRWDGVLWAGICRVGGLNKGRQQFCARIYRLSIKLSVTTLLSTFFSASLWSSLRRYPVRGRVASTAWSHQQSPFLADNGTDLEIFSLAILLIRTAGWFPLVVALLLAFRSGRKDPSLRATSILTTICAWATAIGTSEGLTHTFKVYVQRRRPNFLALCGFRDGLCTANRYSVTDANLSFPSGHSSLAACGMTFLTLAVASQLLLLANTTAPRLPVRWLVASTALSAFSFTLFVGTSRIVDHWHHPSDVLAGWLLGSAVSVASFHVWYPPLWHAHAGRPWSVVLRETRATISSSSSSILPRTTNPKLPSFHE